MVPVIRMTLSCFAITVLFRVAECGRIWRFRFSVIRIYRDTQTRKSASVAFVGFVVFVAFWSFCRELIVLSCFDRFVVFSAIKSGVAEAHRGFLAIKTRDTKGF